MTAYGYHYRRFSDQCWHRNCNSGCRIYELQESDERNKKNRRRRTHLDWGWRRVMFAHAVEGGRTQYR